MSSRHFATNGKWLQETIYVEFGETKAQESIYCQIMREQQPSNLTIFKTF